jgi:hypothetical protein
LKISLLTIKSLLLNRKMKSEWVNEFDPKNYAAYYILTLSIFDSRLSIWKDASKFDIDVKKSIKTVMRNINQMQREKYHLQLLELDIRCSLYFYNDFVIG